MNISNLISHENNSETACGGKINDPDTYPSAIFDGKLVFFCTQVCLRAFESDPAGFMAGKVEHPLDEG